MSPGTAGPNTHVSILADRCSLTHRGPEGYMRRAEPEVAVKARPVA